MPGETDLTEIFTPDQCLRYTITSPIEQRNVSNQIGFKCNKNMFSDVMERCDRWVYDKYDDKTIVQEWSITCKDNQWKLAFVGTCHFAGIVLGSAAAGILADKYDISLRQ